MEIHFKLKDIIFLKITIHQRIEEQVAHPEKDVK